MLIRVCPDAMSHLRFQAAEPSDGISLEVSAPQRICISTPVSKDCTLAVDKSPDPISSMLNPVLAIAR